MQAFEGFRVRRIQGLGLAGSEGRVRVAAWEVGTSDVQKRPRRRTPNCLHRQSFKGSRSSARRKRLEG